MAKQTVKEAADRPAPGMCRQGGSWTKDQDGNFKEGPKPGKPGKPKKNVELEGEQNG